MGQLFQYHVFCFRFSELPHFTFDSDFLMQKNPENELHNDLNQHFHIASTLVLRIYFFEEVCCLVFDFPTEGASWIHSILKTSCHLRKKILNSNSSNI